MDDKKKHKVLLAEDDSNLGVLLCEYLQAKEYSADLAHDGEEAYNMFINDKYDLCIFDVMMPKKDGFTLAKEVRMANVEVPIIFLTARNVKEAGRESKTVCSTGPSKAGMCVILPPSARSICYGTPTAPAMGAEAARRKAFYNR